MSRPVSDSYASAVRPTHLGGFLVACLYALAALWGVAQARAPVNGVLYMLAALSMALAATLWAVNDARCRGKWLPHIVQFLMLLTWPLALPIYLVLSRKLRGVGLAILHAVALYAVMFLMLNVTLTMMK